MARAAPRPGELTESILLLAIVTGDEPWSARQRPDPRGQARIAIDPVILAEVAARCAPAGLVDAGLPGHVFRRESLPRATAFLAGKAFLAYRRAGGARRSPLPEYVIGAHAAVAGHRLLSRDATRYRTYFPRLELVAP